MYHHKESNKKVLMQEKLEINEYDTRYERVIKNLVNIYIDFFEKK